MTIKNDIFVNSINHSHENDSDTNPSENSLELEIEGARGKLAMHQRSKIWLEKHANNNTEKLSPAVWETRIKNNEIAIKQLSSILSLLENKKQFR